MNKFSNNCDLEEGMVEFGRKRMNYFELRNAYLSLRGAKATKQSKPNFGIASLLSVACLPADRFAMTEKGYFVIHSELTLIFNKISASLNKAVIRN